MSSPYLTKKTLTDNLGTQLLINQQQFSHAKRLKQIYNKPPKRYSSQKILPKRNNQKCFKQKQQNYEHHKNIEHLYQFISRPKNMSDRLKDPHDFFAYPTYFFRQVKPKHNLTKVSKTRLQKPKRKTINQSKLQEHQQLAKKFGIDVPTVKKHLPILQYFTEQELQQYTDSITRMIFNYNLNSKERVLFLKDCVLKTIQSSYPTQFPEVIHQIFDELLQSLGFEQK